MTHNAHTNCTAKETHRTKIKQIETELCTESAKKSRRKKKPKGKIDRCDLLTIRFQAAIDVYNVKLYATTYIPFGNIYKRAKERYIHVFC